MRRRSSDRTPSPFRPDTLNIQSPATINLTDSATFSIEAPYNGRVLWTIESDKVLRHEWQSMRAGTQSWTTDLKGESFTNTVYVSALLIKDPHLRISGRLPLKSCAGHSSSSSADPKLATA